MISTTDYYAFGSVLPGRSFNSSEYSFGFQGQEKDDEIADVEGAFVNYKYRMHNIRLGRFFAVDPLTSKYPQWSPYQFSGNQVTATIELEGLEPLKNINDYAVILDEYAAMNGSGAAAQSSLGQGGVFLGNPEDLILGQEIKSAPPPLMEYQISNENFIDRNVGQYAANQMPGVWSSVLFTTTITANQNGNKVTIGGSVDAFNSFNDPMTFTAEVNVYSSTGKLLSTKPLLRNLDYSNGQKYMIPTGWMGSATFELPDPNGVYGQDFTFEVITTGSVRTGHGGATITMPGTFAMYPNYGVNGFDIINVNIK